jgi:hypothetical protein
MTPVFEDLQELSPLDPLIRIDPNQIPSGGITVCDLVIFVDHQYRIVHVFHKLLSRHRHHLQHTVAENCGDKKERLC